MKLMMAFKIAFNAVDTLLRDLLNSDKSFGNIIVIIFGDFQHDLPFLRHGNHTNIIENTVKRSHLWEYFHKISLIENHRLTHADNSFKLN